MGIASQWRKNFPSSRKLAKAGGGLGAEAQGPERAAFLWRDWPTPAALTGAGWFLVFQFWLNLQRELELDTRKDFLSS